MVDHHPGVMSSRSLVGATDAAWHPGFSRRALGYHIGSGLRPDFGGPLLRREQRPEDVDYPADRSPHARFFWETVVAYRHYLGGPGSGSPWGAKRDWDHTPEGFGPWYASAKRDGWQAVDRGSGTWEFVRVEPCTAAEISFVVCRG
jgi:hypothetical protein